MMEYRVPESWVVAVARVLTMARLLFQGSDVPHVARFRWVKSTGVSADGRSHA